MRGGARIHPYPRAGPRSSSPGPQRASAGHASPAAWAVSAWSSVAAQFDVLDQIDKIVPPGVNLNPADGGWVSPALEPAARRR
jgi:hypothetical protein